MANAQAIAVILHGKSGVHRKNCQLWVWANLKTNHDVFLAKCKVD